VNPAAEAPLSCGNCRAPMRRLVLDGHYGARVAIDLCAPCHLVWLDGTEGARLAGTGMLGLLDVMAQSQSLAHHVLGPGAGCARCNGGLKTVHNRSRWGASTQLECRQGHGFYASFAQLLADRGLTRALGPAERAAVIARDGALHCVGCGAAIGRDDERCPQCAALPAVFDVGRLARALDPESTIGTQPVHATPLRHGQRDCPACGAPQASMADFRCGHCGATLAVARLAEASAAVQPLAAALREAAEKPPPEVVARRLEVVDRNAGQQREWAARMQAEADATRRSADWPAFDDEDVPSPVRAGARWFAWILFGAAVLLWFVLLA
jgi:hypothetical protein